MIHFMNNMLMNVQDNFEEQINFTVILLKLGTLTDLNKNKVLKLNAKQK